MGCKFVLKLAVSILVFGAGAALCRAESATLIPPPPSQTAPAQAGAPAASRAQTQWDAGDPTPGEQYVLEMINRARANPTAEGVRLGINITEGLPDPQDVVPKPPLAMNKILLGTARTHIQDMFTNNYFAHNDLSGKSPFDRMTAAGYNWTDAGENIATATSETPAQLEDDLMIDSGIPDRGHRANLLDIHSGGPDFLEIGVGFFQGGAPNPSGFGTFLTQDFGTSTPGPFILGVVYNDANGNGFYDPGEEMAGVNVTPDNGSYFAVTSTSGGYAIPTGTSGSVTLTFSGGALTGPITKTITLAGTNIKVDARASEATGGGSGGGSGSGSGSGGVTGGGSGSGGTVVGGGGTGTGAGTGTESGPGSGGPTGLGGGVTPTGTGPTGQSTDVSNTLVDSDGDGFPDELEAALGTSPTDPKSTPFGGSAAGVAQSILNPKLTIALNFAKSNSDAIALSGGLPIPVGFTVSGQKVTVDVGGVIKNFTLDSKGNAGAGTTDTFKLKVKAVKGVIAAQTGIFTQKSTHGSFAGDLTDEGLINSNITGAALTVPVVILFNNTLYNSVQAQIYTAKASKTGRTK